MRKLKITIMVLLCLTLVGASACTSGGQQNVTREFFDVKRGDLSITVSGNANVAIKQDANLTFGVGGKIDELLVTEGDKVKKGDKLAQLETNSIVLSLTQAKLSLETARYNLDRMKDVKEIKDKIERAETEIDIGEIRLKEALNISDGFAVSYWTKEVAISYAKLVEAQQDLAQLLAKSKYADLVVDDIAIKQLQVEVAEQTLANTQKQLDEATLVAPFDGIVADVYFEEGDTVPAPGVSTRPVIYLIDTTTMELEAEIDEIDVPSVKVGQKVNIEVDALPDLRLEGEITYISPVPVANADPIVYPAKISFKPPEDSGVRAGMTVTANIVIETRENVLLIPNQVIEEDSSGNSIVLVKVGDQIETREVTLGISDGLQTEVTKGLNDGDIVVFEVQTEAPSGFMFGG